MTGKWIWHTNEIKRNDYAEFKIPFKYEKGNVTLNLSAHSEYVVYVNGKYVYSLQYADYPWYKVYDSLNITDYLINDLNEIVIWVWYQGDENLCQYIQTPGLIFDLNVDNKCVLSSSNKTLSRRLNLFNTDNNHLITMQLGYSFHMDNTSKEEVYHDSYELDILDRTYHLRENKRLIVKDNSF